MIDHAKINPKLMMSANWFSEKKMRELFIAGLQCGVRGFDTAREYRVETQVGRALRDALKETGLKREDVFIQTRIGNEEVERGHISDEVRKSMDKMGLEYLDCFMFHWPTPDYYIDRWNTLNDVFENSNWLGSIGLCNCRVRHLQKMQDEGITRLPQIIQVEVTPFWQVNDLKSFCDKRNITIQAFSPLCKMIEPIRTNKILNELSEKFNVGIAQIILKWHIQRGVVPISMSSKVSRVKQNFNLDDFELSDDDMIKIGALDCGFKYHLESTTCYGF